MKPLRIIGAGIACFLGAFSAQAQESQQGLETRQLEIHGDFQADLQYYKEDTLIGAPKVPEQVLLNAFSNFIITYGEFSAGFRYETYLNPLQGFDPRYKGSGFPYRYASYSKENLQVTVGSFYEQFGNGLIFRSYEERNLGVDNAMDGVRLRLEPVKGIHLKGIIGRQRSFFELSPGIVRGIDGEISLNEVIKPFNQSQTNVLLGAGFVSKFQEDNDPTYNLPENVGATSLRATVNRGAFNISGEYAYKINDPSLVNNFNYKPGESLLITAGYSTKGLGVLIGAKRTDNMDFRSDRTAVGNNLNINFLPALTKQHTYNLAATIYPYATQPLGEMSVQGELTYNIARGSKLGGKYGTNIAVNYSKVNALDKEMLNDDNTTRQGYTSDFFKFGDEDYFQDFNVEIQKRFSSNLKGTLMYMNLLYNKDVVQGLSGYGTIKANIGVADITYKLSSRHTIRTELQSLTTKQDQGSWAMGLVEYTFNPHFFAAILDQYNYGNDDEDLRVHYIIGSVGYMGNTSRITASYGRQRAGIVCIGGVCRNMPASNGVTVSVTSSF